MGDDDAELAALAPLARFRCEAYVYFIFPTLYDEESFAPHLESPPKSMPCEMLYGR